MLSDMNLLKKLAIIFAMVIATTASANAQSSQIATLFHDGNITNYTSGTALIDALAAAVDGDVISLSSGIFQAADITKNVTIRGAGMGYPELGGTSAPTILTGAFKIECPEVENKALTLEGLAQTGGTITLNSSKNMTMMKCRIGSIYGNYSYKKWDNIRFIHCIISEIDGPNEASVQFVNSAITKDCYLSHYGSDISYQFDNCVVYTGASVERSSMTNTIVVMQKGSATRTEISASSSINNCIVAGCERYSAANGNNKFCSASEIFTSEGLYNLQDAMKEFKGTDGKEVGIHGGSLPFSPVTTNLKITKFKVAERTTADGKLPVEIEIESN